MLGNQSPTDYFLDLCEKNKHNVFGVCDTDALQNLLRINSDFNMIRQIEESAYKKAKKILDKEIYEIYVHSPKVTALANVFNKALDSDIHFRKNIYQSGVSDAKNSKRNQIRDKSVNIKKKYKLRVKEIISNTKYRYKVEITQEDAIKLLYAELGQEAPKKSKQPHKNIKKLPEYDQTTEEMILYMEEKYSVIISKKEALSILKSEFGNRVNQYVQTEKKRLSIAKKNHSSEKLKEQRNCFNRSNLFNSKKSDKKVGFDFTK
jgi:hypothetical protein